MNLMELLQHPRHLHNLNQPANAPAAYVSTSPSRHIHKGVLLAHPVSLLQVKSNLSLGHHLIDLFSLLLL